jgi:puromycin-sensitive aminopeptidase
MCIMRYMNTTSGGSAKTKKGRFRLPRTVVPSRYEIGLMPDLENFTFTGHETIAVTVLKPVKKIVLNAKDLKIAAAFVTNDSGTRLDGTVKLSDKLEQATISFAGTVGAGEWKLNLMFSGQLNDKLRGFYRSFWTDKDGTKHALATTQFEATDARRAFPCFDEPEFKATFKVSLLVDQHLTALSNAPVVRVTDNFVGCACDGGHTKKLVEFDETMKMSTYLVAFCVGEFVSSKPVFVNGKELRIWTVPGKEHLTGFALRSAAFGLDWYEKYFRIPYPGGKKIDFIAIPDFEAGAMENLGLITFREESLLLDEQTATQGERERVDEVVKHELAHMWFGDLVTMRWWNGLWLNESFATYMSHKCMDAEYPEWHVFDGFGISRAAALRLDGLKSTHPIECPVNHPDEVQELFDLISYEKGCSVLYQIDTFIGQEVFQNGIAAYLAKHSYGNTETHDLWDALEQACREAKLDIPVRKIMDAWVFTAGHPVVEVSEGEADGFVTLSQRQFQFLPEGEGSLFPVPITLRVKSGERVETLKFLFEGKEQSVFVGKGYDYVVVNAGGTGCYRVTYSGKLAAKLTADVGKTLSVIERFNLVNDTWSSVRAGRVSAVDYLKVVELFAGETDPNVWSILLGSLSALHAILPEAARPAMKALVRNLVRPTFDRLGWAPAPGEDVHTRQLRGSLLGTLGTIGADAAVQAKAGELYAAWKTDRSAIDSNLVPSVIGIVAYTGDTARYDEFKAMFKSAATPQDENRFLDALSGFRVPELLRRTLESTLNGEVRTQDSPFLLASLIRNEVIGPEAWSFLKANWEKVNKTYPEAMIPRVCGAVTALDTPELEADVKAFFAEHKVKMGEMAIAQALEALRINVSLRQRDSQKLADHLVPPAQAADSQ